MRCESCDNGDRRPSGRPYVQQKGDRVAVVTNVWFAENVALRLDELLREMLSTELVAVRPFADSTPTAA